MSKQRGLMARTEIEEVFKVFGDRSGRVMLASELRKALAFLHISPFSSDLEMVADKFFKGKGEVDLKEFTEIVGLLEHRRDSFEHVLMSLQMLAESPDFMKTDKFKEILMSSSIQFSQSDIERALENLDPTKSGLVRISDAVTVLLK